MTIIYHTQLPKEEPIGLVEAIISDFPVVLQDRIRLFRRWQDAYSTVVGRLLLNKGLKNFGFLSPVDVQYTDRGKPHLGHHSIRFNISHSGEFVVCALTNTGWDLGIDIEEIKNINVSDFGSIWTEEEEIAIRMKGVSKFYDYWTRKEAIIKADGRGLNLSLNSIDVRSSEVFLEGVKYYLKEIKFHSHYKAYIATTEVDPIYQILKVNQIYNNGYHEKFCMVRNSTP
jgi:4'-phosphopantetheinyl transferase